MIPNPKEVTPYMLLDSYFAAVHVVDVGPVFAFEFLQHLRHDLFSFNDPVTSIADGIIEILITRATKHAATFQFLCQRTARMDGCVSDLSISSETLFSLT